MKPMLASDGDRAKLKFPLYIQPKVDGVRSMHLTRLGLTGRSGKRHANLHVTNFFSQGAFFGLDGEMAAANECDPALCRLTSSALSTIEGQPWILWHVFDYVTPETITWGYEERYMRLQERVALLHATCPELAQHLRVMPSHYCESLEIFENWHDTFDQLGYEGSITRHPLGLNKQGRSTVREAGLLRWKDFVEEEAVVNSINEGQTNMNELGATPHGYAERSTHAANMVPNGMVGSFECTDVKTGKPITVSAGKIPHDLRALWFAQQHLILGKTIKYKTFLKGVKDKPRFPTFQSVKIESDMP